MALTLANGTTEVRRSLNEATAAFWTDTEIARFFNILPIDATLIPLPTELTTPPVTNIYLLISELYASLLRAYS